MLTLLRPAGLLVVAAVLVAGCGGRDDRSATNDDLVGPLADLPIAHRVVDVAEYGYDLGEGNAEDRFFTEIRYAVSPAIDADTIVATVEDHLGDGWDVSTEGDGDAVVASFHRGDARVAVTTWEGGFDVTVAAEGAKLDGTPLAL